MRRLTSRRTVLLTAGVATIAATVAPVASQSSDIRGIVTFEGGAVIPEGYLKLLLEDPATNSNEFRRADKTRIKSDGRSKAIAFSLPSPTDAIASPTLQIIARLERADGWLVARGSARLKVGSPVSLTLNVVMY